ncbi:hypothetical protein IAR55_001730 [Kwoniella newhampshirensis]|uniref:Origin recognition complex subunit 3 winged helix C-terminal domain-containing protein n=1 Tax=Kwoniella newhampshirensis TaxID=1651941 RepID=A0AAW0Z311_9TREE
MEDDFQSLSKGVFVVPFQPPSDENGAGPSILRSGPLDKLYSTTLRRCEEAYTNYESEKTSEQLDDIADWLERCSAPPLLTISCPVHRLPIAILQNASVSLSSLLPTLGPTTLTLHGRDAPDLTTAVRAVAIGFIGEATLSGRKTGRAGLDEVELWWKGKKDKSPLLLHIQEAQLVASSVLAELMYILTLHPDLPIRLLLSVPSTSVFLSSWTHLEPSTIDLCVLQSGRTRRRSGGVKAILKGSRDVPLKVSEDLEEDIINDEDLLGGGSMAAMKALKWLLLHHSINSSLATLAEKTQTPEQLQKVQAWVNAVFAHPDDSSLPGRSLFTLGSNRDLASVTNPAPRTSILHALSNSASYVELSAVSADEAGLDRTPLPNSKKNSRSASKGNTDEGQALQSSTTDGYRQPKRAKLAAASDEDIPHLHEEDLKELEMLFEIWRASGRSVNLWDWLEGFRGSMGQDEDEGKAHPRAEAQEDNGNKRKEDENGDIDMGAEEDVSSRATGGPDDGNDVAGQPNSTFKPKEHDEENEARLHAIFIRFVEEARMMGLVRARGKGRRADEVVKGVGLV